MADGKAQPAFVFYLGGNEVQGKETMGRELGTMFELSLIHISSPVTEFAVASHLNTANSRVEVGKKTVVLPPKICYDYYVYSGGAKMIKTILTIIFIIICVFPVSYTHLGERGAAFEEELGEIEAFFAVDLIFFLSQNQGAVGEIEDKRLGEAPVSYTHLDVYKRQTRFSMCRKNRQGSLNRTKKSLAVRQRWCLRM